MASIPDFLIPSEFQTLSNKIRLAAVISLLYSKLQVNMKLTGFNMIKMYSACHFLCFQNHSARCFCLSLYTEEANLKTFVMFSPKKNNNKLFIVTTTAQKYLFYSLVLKNRKFSVYFRNCIGRTNFWL